MPDPKTLEDIEETHNKEIAEWVRMEFRKAQSESGNTLGHQSSIFSEGMLRGFFIGLRLLKYFKNKF